MLDYVDLGVDILSGRGYDMLEDAVDFGRHVIPIIRDEVTKRDAAGTASAERARDVRSARIAAGPATAAA